MSSLRKCTQIGVGGGGSGSILQSKRQDESIMFLKCCWEIRDSFSAWIPVMYPRIAFATTHALKTATEYAKYSSICEDWENAHFL